MRLLICGDRNWQNRKLIEREIRRLEPGVVIHGAARGADSLAGQICDAIGIEVESYPAEWSKYGRAAGPIRNQQMIDEGKPDRVLAFHDDLGKSKGTADMVRRARKAGLPVEVVGLDGRRIECSPGDKKGFGL